MGASDYTKYLGPLGYGIDAIKGDAGDPMSYLDPGDLFGKQASKDVLAAGKEAQAQLQRLSDVAWQRQMQGLQLALGSMNNYNGVLSNLYGVPTNQYDPALLGGQLGKAPSTPGTGAPTAPGGLGGTYPAFQPSAPPGGLGGIYPAFQPNGVDSNVRPGFVPSVPPAAGPSVEALRGIGHF